MTGKRYQFPHYSLMLWGLPLFIMGLFFAIYAGIGIGDKSTNEREQKGFGSQAANITMVVVGVCFLLTGMSFMYWAGEHNVRLLDNQKLDVKSTTYCCCVRDDYALGIDRIDHAEAVDACSEAGCGGFCCDGMCHRPLIRKVDGGTVDLYPPFACCEMFCDQLSGCCFGDTPRKKVIQLNDEIQRAKAPPVSAQMGDTVSKAKSGVMNMLGLGGGSSQPAPQPAYSQPPQPVYSQPAQPMYSQQPPPVYGQASHAPPPVQASAYTPATYGVAPQAQAQPYQPATYQAAPGNEYRVAQY